MMCNIANWAERYSPRDENYENICDAYYEHYQCDCTDPENYNFEDKGRFLILNHYSGILVKNGMSNKFLLMTLIAWYISDSEHWQHWLILLKTVKICAAGLKPLKIHFWLTMTMAWGNVKWLSPVVVHSQQSVPRKRNQMNQVDLSMDNRRPVKNPDGGLLLLLHLQSLFSVRFSSTVEINNIRSFHQVWYIR